MISNCFLKVSKVLTNFNESGRLFQVLVAT